MGAKAVLWQDFRLELSGHVASLHANAPAVVS